MIYKKKPMAKDILTFFFKSLFVNILTFLQIMLYYLLGGYTFFVPYQKL